MSFQGKVNAYDCPDCRATMYTVDRDEGVTPFMLACRMTDGCGGMARSRMYRNLDPAATPKWEWYKPSKNRARRAGPGMFEHWSAGGLFLRRIEGP